MTGWCVDDSTTVYLRHMPVHQHCCRSSRVCCCGLLATVTAPETLLCWNVLQLCWASPPLLHTPLQCNPYASVQLAASQPQALPSQLQALVIVLGTKPLCPRARPPSLWPTVSLDLETSLSCCRRASGTVTMPTLGSMVQKGKLAAAALPFSTIALNSVDCRPDSQETRMAEV